MATLAEFSGVSEYDKNTSLRLNFVNNDYALYDERVNSATMQLVYVNAFSGYVAGSSLSDGYLAKVLSTTASAQSFDSSQAYATYRYSGVLNSQGSSDVSAKVFCTAQTSGSISAISSANYRLNSFYSASAASSGNSSSLSLFVGLTSQYAATQGSSSSSFYAQAISNQSFSVNGQTQAIGVPSVIDFSTVAKEYVETIKYQKKFNILRLK